MLTWPQFFRGFKDLAAFFCMIERIWPWLPWASPVKQVVCVRCVLWAQAAHFLALQSGFDHQQLRNLGWKTFLWHLCIGPCLKVEKRVFLLSLYPWFSSFIFLFMPNSTVVLVKEAFWIIELCLAFLPK